MRRELSTRSLALIAVSLAVASAMFCWRWAMRYVNVVERYGQTVIVVESKQDDLEERMLNIAAFLLKSSEDSPRAGRVEPWDRRVAEMCRELRSDTSLLRTFETARADLFFLWYYEQMKRCHPRKRAEHEPAPWDAAPLTASPADNDSPVLPDVCRDATDGEDSSQQLSMNRRGERALR